MEITNKKNGKETAKMVTIKALKGAPHMIEGKKYEVGVETAKVLIDAKRATKA